MSHTSRPTIPSRADLNKSLRLIHTWHGKISVLGAQEPWVIEQWAEVSRWLHQVDQALWSDGDKGLALAHALMSQLTPRAEALGRAVGIPLPCKASPGRPTDSGSVSDEQRLEQLIHAVRQLRHRGHSPTQARVMAKLGLQGDTRRVREWWQHLGFSSWKDFLAHV